MLTAAMTAGYCKSLSVWRVDVVYQASLGITFDILGYQDIKPFDLDRFLILMRLIQSQPQTGSASTESLECNTQIFPGVVIKHFF
jgi:hypothetical protein